jgi:hypothetical protein
VKKLIAHCTCVHLESQDKGLVHKINHMCLNFPNM